MEKKNDYIKPQIQSIEFLVEQSVLASSEVNAQGGFELQDFKVEIWND